ncbi:type VI secretion system TssO [Dysgonomonas sp. 511]|uniref:type VI secretion system TssO n=1 Tax=Dysgonomonas sp. 511 TaxID=2302930 RepID=UPI0013D54850|nr:type VI secretion system TssO [Dysgonomonas sp. 511]NDV78479.1 type VI secretion system transmembrane protein TssQ [Dysgonomonas sp. 511]
MRAKNHKEVTRGYLKFSGYLIACVVTGVLVYTCYIWTSNVEVNRIIEKTDEYDKIYVKQIDLTNRIDSLYQYTTLFNTKYHDVHLHHLVSRHKQEILSVMDGMNSRDIRLYQKLMNEINVFLSVKDSISVIKGDEDFAKEELKTCRNKNTEVAQQIKSGNTAKK